MAVTKERLQIIIEALNLSRDEMKQLQNDLEGTESKSRGTKSGLQDMRVSLATLTAVAGSATAAFYALKKAFDVAKSRAEFERLQESGRRLASQFSQDMDEIVTSVVLASGNTIDRMAAMKAANNAMILDVAKTPEEFEKLTKAAVALGRATGRSATQAINDLTTGIGRQSRMILDNLGIVVDAEKDYGAYAKQIGKTADELTDAEKKQALLNKAIEAAQPLLDENQDLIKDNASEYEKFTAQLKDLKLAMGDTVEDNMRPMIKAWNDHREANVLAARAAELYNSGMADIKWGAKQAGMSVAEYALEVIRLHDAMTDSADEIDNYDELIGQVGETSEKTAESIDKITQALNNMTDGIETMPIENFLRLTGAPMPVRMSQAARNRAERLAEDYPETGWGAGPGSGGSPGTITVESGDTLSELAADLGTSVRALMEANPEIDNPSLIHAGQVLKTGFLEAADAVSGSTDSIDTKLNNLTSQPHTIDVRVNIMDPEQRTPFTQMIKEEIRESMR